jgi:hypothetical protein
MHQKVYMAPGVTLPMRAGVEASAAVRTNSSARAFVPAPFVPDCSLIDGKHPVSGGGTIFGNPGRNILRGPDQGEFCKSIQMTFRPPSTCGVISGLTVNPRIMQNALKLEF